MSYVYLYSEPTYDVCRREDGALIAFCTDKECGCKGWWVLQQAPDPQQ